MFPSLFEGYRRGDREFFRRHAVNCHGISPEELERFLDSKVKFFQKSGAEMDAWWDPSTATQPQGWTTNILKATIDASILPTSLITLN